MIELGWRRKNSHFKVILLKRKVLAFLEDKLRSSIQQNENLRQELSHAKKEKEDLALSFKAEVEKLQKEKAEAAEIFLKSSADADAALQEERERHEQTQLQALSDVEASFRSAICQALALNPGLSTWGISLFHFVEDGKIMTSKDGVKKVVDLNDPYLPLFDPSTPTNEENEANAYLSDSGAHADNPN